MGKILGIYPTKLAYVWGKWAYQQVGLSSWHTSKHVDKIRCVEIIKIRYTFVKILRNKYIHCSFDQLRGQIYYLIGTHRS